MRHHALGEQPGEGLRQARDARCRCIAAGEEAAVEQVQDRVLDAADILVHRQPGSTAARVTGSAARGEQKRAKYQELSTKVSQVSVSRRAGLPQRGQATCFQVGWWSSGLPGPSRSPRRPAASPATGRPAPAPRRRPRNG